MKKNRVLAVVMAVLMMVTLLPSMVFAAEVPSGTLDGNLKVKGTIAVGCDLTADYSKVKPEGITDDQVNFSWSVKDGDLLTEVGTDKTYKIDEKDLGLPIVLKITGKEEQGISGELTVTTLEVAATEEDAKALAEQKKAEAKTTGEKEEADSTDTEENQDTEEVSKDSETENADSAESAEEEVSQDAQENDENVNADSTESAGEEVSQDTEENGETENTDASDSSEETSQEDMNTDAENSSEGTDSEENPDSDQNTVVEVNGEDSDSGNNAEADGETQAKDSGNDSADESSDSGEVVIKNDEDQDKEQDPDTGNGNEDQGLGGNEVETGEKFYELTADPAELPFEVPLTAGYEEVTETQTVTIENTGTETITLVQPQSDIFDVMPVNEVESEGEIQLSPGDSQTFTVQPKLGLEAQTDPYTDKLVFSATEDENTYATVTASVTVNEDTPKITSASAGPDLDFESVEEGYDTAPEAQTVTVENTGTETIDLGQPSVENGNYEIGTISPEVINAGEKATFTVQPVTGLQAGDHSSTISVTDADGNMLDEVSVKFTVTAPEPKYGISVSPESLEFGSVEEGYKNVPEAQSVTVTNEGNTSITLEQPTSDNYTIGELSATELDGGESATFTVQPASGLSNKEYLEDISILDSADQGAYVNVHFSVTKRSTDSGKKDNNLTGIRKPSDISDLPNGTEKTQEALQLPGTVKITTTKGEQEASVKWDVKGCSYDPSSVDRQTFNVKGTVTLPDGVKNPNKISTVIAVSVTVNGYNGTEAAASDNKINGIDPSGKYDTNTKITFTAVGAGMDNTSPRKGDTRYLPKSWKITETRTWDTEPYTATFRVSKPGDYTLKVNFGQQKYDGAEWKDTGTQSESSVTFTVSQAEILTATPSPAVTQTNKKSAVQTGDSTPIMPFVIILIVAVVCIGGILVYRRKKK